MKKYGKETLLVLITTIIVSAISVSATVYYNSENVTFTPTNTDWNVTNTNAALNDLYSFTNNGNASASDILTGKTALVSGQLITGTMEDKGAWSTTVSAGSSVTIPAGYHNGSGTVTASNSSSSSDIVNVYKGSVAPVNINANTPNTVTFKAPKTGNLIIDINYDGGAIRGRAYPISVGATNCRVIQQDLPIYESKYSGFLLAGTCQEGENITVTIYAWNDAISSTYTVNAYII